VRVVQRELADRTVLPLALLLKVVVARAALIKARAISRASSQNSLFGMTREIILIRISDIVNADLFL